MYSRIFCLIFLIDGNYELSRDQVELNEIIGEGQFGDVHKGICLMRTTKNTPSKTVAVAIKTCKPDADIATTDKFLEEACKYDFYYGKQHIYINNQLKIVFYFLCRHYATI